jgi:hypothetical protein
MRLRDEVSIAADAARVWELTLDVERWNELTTSITSVERLDEGPLRLGSAARIVQPRQRPRVWTVTRLEVNRCFAWRTRTGPFTMTGTHLIAADEHGCRNTLVLELAGPGSAVVGRLLRRSLAAALREENDGFKRAAETCRDPEATSNHPGDT